MSGTLFNRFDGAVKVFVGCCGLTAAVCFTLLGWWIAVAFWFLGGAQLARGLMQVVTGGPSEDC
jgi:hypothetical protein